MILTKEVEIKISSSNMKYFSSLGYENIHFGGRITVLVEHLKPCSTTLVLVKCDVCGEEKVLPYGVYLKNISNYNFFSCKKCSRIKTEKTFLIKFGKKNYMQTKDFREKSEQTNLKKYGNKCPFKSEIIKNKIIQTNKKKYGCENPFENNDIKKKIKNTLLEKYKCENPSQNEEIKSKIKTTNVRKYGCVSPLQNEKVKEKIKKTVLNKYGVEHSSKNEKVKKKGRNTNLKKYGTNSPMQNFEVFKKCQKTSLKIKIHEQTGLNYQGTYEKHFLDFCFENNITIKKGKSIKYSFNKKTKIYFSDFYYEKNNLIVEIKSHYYYKKHLKKNLAKRKACIEQGYNFIFIIDKNYSGFKKLLI